MATTTKHYEAVCKMPACICVDGDVAMFLKDDRLTIDVQPWIRGTVESITEDASGGVDVVISYDQDNMPLNELVHFAATFGEEGTVCDPDCLGECDWLSKVLKLITSGIAKIVNRFYQLFSPEEDVVLGEFEIARIPFPTGLLLSDVRLTCYQYDANTTIEAVLMNGADMIAHATGNLGGQLQFTIDEALVPYDAKPLLQITALDNTVYGVAAKGLVLELIGVIGTP